MSMQSIRTMCRLLMAYGVSLAVAALAFGSGWPDAARWGFTLLGAACSLFGAIALRGLGPENETPIDWLDTSEWPSAESTSMHSTLGVVAGWTALLLAGFGTAFSLAIAVLYLKGDSLAAHPTGTQGRDAALAIVAAMIFGFSLPFLLLRPAHRW